MIVPMVDATPWRSFLRRAARLDLLRALLRTGTAIGFYTSIRRSKSQGHLKAFELAYNYKQ
jgi:hypothetical protein